MVSRVVVAVSAVLIFGAAAFGQGSNAAAVEQGKEVFGVVCTACHSANHVSIQRKLAPAWRNTIYTMIGRGAQILPSEIEPLAAYLASTYGPGSPLPAPRGATVGAPAPAGSEIVIRSCGGCHSVNLIFNSRKSVDGWKGTIKYMRSNGARISETEEQELAAYLGEHFGTR
jgi:mono/diheme cytochrome c family protein